MRYVLDTNIILHCARNSMLWQTTKHRYQLHRSEHHIYISIVTYAEIKSLAQQLNWGQTKRKHLEDILSNIPTLYLNKAVSEEYVSIDVYSQGKDSRRPLPQGITARNMGKNDLWIAATTRLIHAHLLTTDRDFDHLHDIFFPVHCVA